MLHSLEAEEEFLEKHNVSESIPRPSSLQWVSVGKGGRISNIRTVRSHVSREHRQRKRESKKASLVNLTKTRQTELRPGRIAGDGSTEGSPDHDVDSYERSQNIAQREDTTVAERKLGARPLSTPPSPLSAVYNHATNLIPYSWFEQNGPVLYVNRMNWPFPTPFNITGSDRSDLSYKSLTPRQSGWTPALKRANDFTGVKGAVLDPNVLLWIGESTECFQFRVECITWIQDRLDDPVAATSNNTIASIMTFAMWTAGYGDPVEMKNHMDAVERIVNLRGGFHTFYEDGTMAAKLTLFDSMIAVQTGQQTRFPPIDYLIAQPLTPTIEAYMARHKSPLFGKGNFADMISYPKNQETIITLLEKLWKLTQKFDIQNRFTCRWQPNHTIAFTTDSSRYYTIPLLTLPLLSQSTDPTQNPVLETLLSASVIYSRSLTYPDTDFPSPRNEKAFQELCTAFGKCSDDEFWVQYPGILLWVVLVGTAASRAKKHAAFWMFYLSRTGSFSTAETWLMGSAAIRRFLELQKWMRKGHLGG